MPGVGGGRTLRAREDGLWCVTCKALSGKAGIEREEVPAGYLTVLSVSS